MSDGSQRAFGLAVGLLVIGCGTPTEAPHPLSDSGVVDSPSAADVIVKNTFCQTQAATPFFCQDFDEGDLSVAFRQGLPVSIGLPNSAAGGLASIGALVRTPPGSFRAQISISDAGKSFVRFEHPAGIGTPTNAKFGISFDFHLAALNDAAEIASLYERDANGVIVAYVELAAYPINGQTKLIAGIQVNGKNGIANAQVRPTEEWTHVDLALDITAAATLSFAMDNQTPVTAQSGSPVGAVMGDWDLGVSPLAEPGTPVDVAFDNVLAGPR